MRIFLTGKGGKIKGKGGTRSREKNDNSEVPMAGKDMKIKINTNWHY